MPNRMQHIWRLEIHMDRLFFSWEFVPFSGFLSSNVFLKFKVEMGNYELLKFCREHPFQLLAGCDG